MTDQPAPRYPAAHAPTGRLRFALVSIGAATFVGWIFGGTWLSFQAPSSLALGGIEEFWVDLLMWVGIIVPFTMILSGILVLLSLATGAGSARLTRSRWVRLAVIATVMALTSAPMVWIIGTAVAGTPSAMAMITVALVVGLSLAASAVAPWKGGFADPARAARPPAND